MKIWLKIPYSFDFISSYRKLPTMVKCCYLTRPHGPCQVKECKISLEQSLLTGWLAMYMDCQPRFQFLEPKPDRILQRGWDFFWKMEAADQCCRKIMRYSEGSILGKVWRHLILEDVFITGLMRYIISECAETLGVKGSTLESSKKDFFNRTLNIRMDEGRLEVLNSVNIVYKEKFLG